MKKRKPQKFPILFLVVGIFLLILSAALILSQNGTVQATQPSPVASGHGEDTFPEIPRVSLADSKAALDNGKAIFIDVRDASAYAESHVPGALSIPLAELEERLGELDSAQWIITYCT